MTRQEADRLKMGDRVEARFDGKNIQGEVTSVNRGVAVFVLWADGHRSATHPSGIVASCWRKVKS